MVEADDAAVSGIVEHSRVGAVLFGLEDISSTLVSLAEVSQCQPPTVRFHCANLDCILPMNGLSDGRVHVLRCIFLHIISECSFVNHEGRVFGLTNERMTRNGIAGIANFDARLVLDYNTEGLQAVGDMHWFEQGNAFGLQVAAELFESLLLMLEVICKNIGKLRCLS